MRRHGVSLGVLLAMTVAGLGLARPAAAAPESCETAMTDYCVEDELELPGRPPEPPRREGRDAVPAGQPARRPASAPVCTWEEDADAAVPGAPPGAGGTQDFRMLYERCDGELTGRVRFRDFVRFEPPGEPDEPAAPAVSPEQLATAIRVRLEGELPQPAIATSPAAGQAAIVNHPTFLAVENWTETVTDEECAFVLCVTVTATASLTWSPGEPGADIVECAGGGSTFDPSGPQATTQAANPGSCAHAYQARTGVDGRPAAWTSTATVTWALEWASTSGATGTLPSVVRSASVERPVDEVQAIVAR